MIAEDDTYTRFFSALSAAREQFHTFGGIEDSNAKLDELLKLVVIALSEQAGTIPAVEDRASARDAYRAVISRPEFQLDSGGSIFEANSSLRIADESEALFRLFWAAAEEIVEASDGEWGLGADLLNEAFGHFVRENFRGNTEDAQYMTPPEVTSFMVEVALHYLEEGRLSGKPLSVADPSCGVGSFLLEFEKTRRLRDEPSSTLVGQDKVRRMLRLAHVSGTCASVDDFHLGLGNSLDDRSWISQYDGKIDLILTNPPFGARFDRDWLREYAQEGLPFFSGVRGLRQSVDSEFLFLERYLTLLKKGGLLLVVVPDGVVSGTGVAALTRHYLATNADLLGVYQLPSVAFAQAGTRTRTSILVLRKGKSPKVTFTGADVEELGFDVVRRKGVSIKRGGRKNQLDTVLQHLNSAAPAGAPSVLSTSPLIVSGTVDAATLSAWDVRQFSTHRLQSDIDVFDYVPLSEVADFVGAERRSQKYAPGVNYLSILHLVSEGVWDYPSIERYQPITPGTPARAGEVLISKINPRIPRVGIVPDLCGTILVSTEFEILSPKAPITAAALSFLLRDKYVQDQLEACASGTSASHNRVRPEKLREVLVRIPRDRRGFQQLMVEYDSALSAISAGLRSVQRLRHHVSVAEETP